MDTGAEMDPDTIHAMLGAAKDNDVITVGSLLNAKASPDTANTINQSALHIASMWGSLDVVRLLMAAGAKPNIQNRFGATPLHCAAQRSQADVGRYLIENGADPTIPAGNQFRPFEMCPDPDLRKAFGAPRTELHDAIRSEDPASAIVQLLSSDPSFNLNAMDVDGDTPLCLAARMELPATCALLLEKQADPCLQNRSGLSPLHIAAGLSLDPAAGSVAPSVSLVRMLLAAGADANQLTQLRTEYTDGTWERKEADGSSSVVSDKGTSALHLAVEACNDSDEVVKLLLEHGANVNVRDGEVQATPLHVALEAEHMNVVRVLLAAGADLSLGNRDIGLESSPLHEACKGRDEFTVRMLVEAKADVNQGGRGGMTPLHIVARSGTATMAAILLEAGGDTNAKDSKGLRPLDLAKANPRQGAVRDTLAAAGGD